MISRYIDLAAKMARLMFNAGRDGLTKEQALELMLEGLPNVPMKAQLEKALRHYFK